MRSACARAAAAAVAIAAPAHQGLGAPRDDGTEPDSSLCMRRLNANIGLALGPSRLVVIDVDSRNVSQSRPARDSNRTLRRRSACHTGFTFGFQPHLRRKDPTMQGIMTFNSISSALQAGYQVYDRTEKGYVMRIKTQAGWGLALVESK
jgi:hypothetical protein